MVFFGMFTQGSTQKMGLVIWNMFYFSIDWESQVREIFLRRVETIRLGKPRNDRLSLPNRSAGWLLHHGDFRGMVVLGISMANEWRMQRVSRNGR